MRRKEMEITDLGEIEGIIERAQVVRLAMCDGDMPYLVPLCFGYQDKTIYIHCALEGKKMDILAKNSNVCFEMDVDHKIEIGDNACACSMKYKSVIGTGTARIIDDPSEKSTALDLINQHYCAPTEDYPEALLKVMKVIKVEVREMTGKRSE